MKNWIVMWGLMAFLWSVDTWAGKLPPGFVEIEIAGGLDPTDFAIANDGRIFIVEKKGRILLVRDGKVLDVPFMEIDVDNTNERGLQSMVLDPDFENNQYFYLFYTVPVGNFNRVSRFQANGDRVVPGSEVVLYELDPTIGTVHNGGAMLIGRDGKLYFSAGDGAATWRAQWNDQTLGKILRINLDGSIPDDNPNSFGNGKHRAIVAKGLRNPFNMAESEDGTIFINDVGGDLYEEVNKLEFGANYGWPYAEGFNPDPDPPQDYVDPFFAYDHDFGCAVIGGVFCPSDNLQFPEEYRGKYLFSDYCQGFIQVLDPQTGQLEGAFATDIDRPLRMNFDDEGSLYYLERAGIGGGSQGDNTASSNGRLLKVTFTGNGIPVVSKNPQSQIHSVGEDAFFTASANGSDTMRYIWRIDGIEQVDGLADSFRISSVDLTQDGALIDCIVYNDEGRDTSAVAVLTVTDNQRPEPVITLRSRSLYRAGEDLIIAGSATDNEDGVISSDRFDWRIVFHHDLHTHPALSGVSGVEELIYPIPSQGEIDDDVWYRVYLTVEDSEGLFQTTFLDVFPEKTDLLFLSEPVKAQLNVDGQLDSTPISITSVVGIQRSVSAPGFFLGEDRAYVFETWKDGTSERDRSFDAPPGNDTLVAVFEGVEYGNGNGLLGSYYDFDDQPVFPNSPVFTRVDSVIDFVWDSTPDTVLFGTSKWMIKWEGYIEPLMDEDYVFGFDVRSGVRLYIDGINIIDDWNDNPTVFRESQPIALKRGERYPIIIEYMTLGSIGTARLYWSNEVMPLQAIPTSQLYAEKLSVDSPISTELSVRPNPFWNEIVLELTAPVGSLEAIVYDLLGREVSYSTIGNPTGSAVKTIDLSNLRSGQYILLLRHQEGGEHSLPIVKMPTD
jgi:glucose/arabinose dehydrogenase